MSRIRQLGTGTRGRSRNSCAEAHVSGCQPSWRIKGSRDSRTEISSSTNRLVATLESVLNEREEHAILFVVAIEKYADMTYFAELGACKGNRCCRFLHAVLLHGHRPRGGFLCCPAHSIHLIRPVSGPGRPLFRSVMKMRNVVSSRGIIGRTRRSPAASLYSGSAISTIRAQRRHRRQRTASA